MSEKDVSNRDDNGDPDRSPKVGALLKASRLRVGDDLREVSEVLRIRYLYLEAIEECKYEDLPGDTYAVGFIRSYAEHLGIDGEEVVRRFRAEQAGKKSVDALSFPTPVPESGMPKGAIVFVGVVLALIVYGGWYVTTTDENALTDLISPVPERLKHLISDEDAPANADSQSATDEKPEGAEAEPPSAAGSGDAGSTTAEVSTPVVSEETQQTVRENTEEALAEAAAAAEESIAATEERAAEQVQQVTEQAETVEVPEANKPSNSDPITDVTTSAEEAVTEQAEPVTDVQATQPSVAATETTATISEETASGQDTVSAETGVNTSAAEAPGQQASEPEAAQSEPEAEPEAESEAEPEAEPGAEPDAETVADAPETEASVDTGEAETSTPASETQAAPEAEQVTADDLNAQVLQAATGETAPAPATPDNSVSEQAETAAVQTDSGAGIVLRASESSWVQVTDPDRGEVLFTGLLGPGETFDIPDREGLLLDTGNAGALDILVDGVSVPKLGGVGTVRKGVTLDGERLKAGTATN